MKKIIIFICMLGLFFSLAAQEACPDVIPALQQWKGGKGKLCLPSKGRIVVAASDEEKLSATAHILAGDLKEMFGWEYIVCTGKSQKNDIVLSLISPDKELGDEGYIMNIGRNATLSAPTAKGVFWGTRSLLQILNNEQGALPKGVARDFPLFPNRGFMLDVARKFFTIDYLRQYVKILSFY